MRKFLIVASALSFFVALVPAASQARIWCARPLWVHEWGVQAFGPDRAQRTGPTLPSYYHDRAAGTPSTSAVRHLPIDGGDRDLPIVHFYAADNGAPVPLGYEVGFTQGEATRWYPQADRRVPAATANGANARAARARLLASRQGRNPMNATPLPADPTRQIEWSSLALTGTATHTPHASEVGWVDTLRNIPGALWVNGASESERFLFYDARTTEQPAITVERGNTFGAQRHHYLLRNRGSHPVHDVFLIQRDASGAIAFYAPTIAAGQTASVVLEEHRVAAADLARETRERLRTALTDAQQPAPPREFRWDQSDCVMMRDPGNPVERAEGHRLYAAEVNAILEIWGARFFDRQGTTIVYREDTAYLDEVMPVSVYTDMHHFVLMRRAGLALMEEVVLP